jgi:antitoxin HigA-1
MRALIPSASVLRSCTGPRHARHTLSRVLNGHASISPDMAIRLEKAGWSNADHWLRLQIAYDLAQARRHERDIRVRRYEPRPAA